MADNPAFLAVLEQMADVATSKNHDYADDDNPFSNFEGTARSAGLSVDQVFQVMVGIKVERLRQLVGGKEPNNESIEDTILDLANYAALWLAYKQWQDPMRVSPPMDYFSTNVFVPLEERMMTTGPLEGVQGVPT